MQSSSQSDHHWRTAIYLIALTATGVVAPTVFLGNASGHDFQPHVAGWIEAAAQWREGILFPRWAQWANSGFGEPRFIFYPPGSWMLGAALGSVLPWKVVPGAFVWLALIIAGTSMWKFAGQWLSPTQAIAAAIFFAANPYHLSIVFYRSAFAELLASALFPLMLMGTFGVLRHEWRHVPLLGFAFAAVWWSNAPAGVIATYSLALILGVGFIVNRSIRPLVLGGLSMLAGFGVAAFYLIPAWWEQRWVQIAQAVSIAYNPEKNFLFTRVNDPDFIQFNWKISAVALALILFTGVGVALSFKQRRAWPRVWWTLTVLSVACTILMLPPSAWLWRHLPKLRFLQFPWRWLLVLSFAFAFFGAAAGNLKRRVIWWAILITAIWVTGVTIGGDTSWSSEDVSSVVEDIRAGRGYDGIEGFGPLAAKVDELDDELPLVGEYDPSSGDIDEPGEAQVNTVKWSAESKVFDVKSDEPVTLALKLLNYPAWQVQVDGSFIGSSVTQTGQLLVPLTAGSHHVEVEFRRTTDRTVGLFISVLSIVGLLIPAGFMLRERMSPRKNPS